MQTRSPIITKILTEKSTSLERLNVSVFEVRRDANKHMIGVEIARLYTQKPLKITVVTRPSQTRRVGKLRREVHTPVRKIAYVKTAKPIENLKKVTS